MTTTVTPGLELMADGRTITLLDGSVVGVRYSMRSLALLEARFGSVMAIQTALDASGKSAAFGPVIDLIGPGCIGAGGFEPHVREVIGTNGKREIATILYRRKRDGMELGELLGPDRLTEYVTAMAVGISAALGAGGQGNDATPAPAAPPPATSSPGLTSGTWPSADSASPPATSGT